MIARRATNRAVRGSRIALALVASLAALSWLAGGGIAGPLASEVENSGNEFSAAADFDSGGG